MHFLKRELSVSLYIYAGNSLQSISKNTHDLCSVTVIAIAAVIAVTITVTGTITVAIIWVIIISSSSHEPGYYCPIFIFLFKAETSVLFALISCIHCLKFTFCLPMKQWGLPNLARNLSVSKNRKTSKRKLPLPLFLVHMFIHTYIYNWKQKWRSKNV